RHDFDKIYTETTINRQKKLGKPTHATPELAKTSDDTYIPKTLEDFNKLTKADWLALSPDDKAAFIEDMQESGVPDSVPESALSEWEPGYFAGQGEGVPLT